MWCLIVSITDLCHLSFLEIQTPVTLLNVSFNSGKKWICYIMQWYTDAYSILPGSCLLRPPPHIHNLDSHAWIQKILSERVKLWRVFSVLFFMPPKELWETYSNHTVCPSVPLSVLLRVWCISLIFFEVGILNLVCGCILRWQSVTHHFGSLWPWPLIWSLEYPCLEHISYII